MEREQRRIRAMYRGATLPVDSLYRIMDGARVMRDRSINNARRHTLAIIIDRAAKTVADYYALTEEGAD
jgi:hypothetical protein